LLKFYDSKPLLTDAGLIWLQIHGANCMADDCCPEGTCPFAGKSLDKASIDVRTAWVEHHSEAICRVAEDPLAKEVFEAVQAEAVGPFSLLPVGNRWWMKADKGDHAFQFLAFCFEWAAFVQHCKQGHQPLAFESSIPVGMDGSCNGLQHFAALFQDEQLGKLVNLVPSEEPQDVYRVMAVRAQEILDQDADEDNPHALYWRQQGLKITRKFMKLPVMTLAYSATPVTLWDQIIEFLGKAHKNTTHENSENLKYLLSIVRHVLKTGELSTAVTAMEWLQDLMWKGDANVVEWIAPSGFPVQQMDLHQEEFRINEYLGGKPYKPKVSGSKGISIQQQTYSIAPNLIHSLDAAHLVKTVNAARDEYGVTHIASIHDCYYTHATDAANLARALRVEFAKMYLGGGGGGPSPMGPTVEKHKVSLQFSLGRTGEDGDMIPSSQPYLVSATVATAGDFGYAMDFTKTLGEYYQDGQILGAFPVQVTHSFGSTVFDTIERMIIESKFKDHPEIQEFLIAYRGGPVTDEQHLATLKAFRRPVFDKYGNPVMLKNGTQQKTAQRIEVSPDGIPDLKPRPSLGTLNLFDIMNSPYSFS
jgi:hypothetical protein